MEIISGGRRGGRGLLGAMPKNRLEDSAKEET